MNNVPVKRHRDMNQQITQLSNNALESSTTGCRFATNPFPFSPFTVVFPQEVRDKVAVDDLTKHAKENFQF